MKKLTLFNLLISAFASISIAQQKIVFEEIVDTMKYNPIQKNYVLPKLVSCTFSNGINQQLILDKIKDDSLIFKKVNNESQNFDCVYSSIKKIKIHKKGENILYVFFWSSVGITIYTINAAINNSLIWPEGRNGNKKALIFTALSVVPISIAIISASTFSKSYRPNKWKLIAK